MRNQHKEHVSGTVILSEDRLNVSIPANVKHEDKVEAYDVPVLVGSLYLVL